MPEDARHAADVSEATSSTRRSLLTTAAWSVPAIAAAVAAPLAAASTPTTCPSGVVAAVLQDYSIVAVRPSGYILLEFYPWAFGIDLTGLLPADYGDFALATWTAATLTTTAESGVVSAFAGFSVSSAHLVVGAISRAATHLYFEHFHMPGEYYHEGSIPARLTSLSLSMVMRFTLPGGTTLECPHTFTWNLGGTVTGSTYGILLFNGTPTVA